MLIVNPLNSELAFPILECFHIAGFAVAIGSVALVDFRLLGLGLSRETPAELSSNTGWWMLGGLIVAIFSGLLLFTTDPDMYYLNWSFVIKMACLIAAITFNYTIHRKVVRSGVSTAGGKLAACLSLGLWISVIFGGIFIAFVPNGLD